MTSKIGNKKKFEFEDIAFKKNANTFSDANVIKFV